MMLDIDFALLYHVNVIAYNIPAGMHYLPVLIENRKATHGLFLPLTAWIWVASDRCIGYAKESVMTVLGHPRSLISLPIRSTHAANFQRVYVAELAVL